MQGRAARAFRSNKCGAVVGIDQATDTIAVVDSEPAKYCRRLGGNHGFEGYLTTKIHVLCLIYGYYDWSFTLFSEHLCKWTTRKPELYGDDLASWLEYGASPRGTISLDRCARAHSWIQGRDFVSPDDVQEILFDVLRHRILLSFEAEASGVTPDQVLETIRERVPSA